MEVLAAIVFYIFFSWLHKTFFSKCHLIAQVLMTVWGWGVAASFYYVPDLLEKGIDPLRIIVTMGVLPLIPVGFTACAALINELINKYLDNIKHIQPKP
ncbi:MAG: hypothetical protein LBQ83_01880 [Candidatus Margulisbacteria bacterium]|jgi:hypothetical protein|nr:hypothetical protein [Candidatus Margulisiibacteriota bacterium]